MNETLHHLMDKNQHIDNTVCVHNTAVVLPGRSPEYIFGCLKTGIRVAAFSLDMCDGCKVGSNRGSIDSASWT